MKKLTDEQIREASVEELRQHWQQVVRRKDAEKFEGYAQRLHDWMLEKMWANEA